MKGQLSLEFVFAAAAAILISGIIIISISSQFNQLREEKEIFLLKDTSKNIRDEIFIASEAEEGFERAFIVPHNLSGMNYTAIISGTSLILNGYDMEMVLKVPSVSGSLAKGQNIIRKQGGVIHLN